MKEKVCTIDIVELHLKSLFILKYYDYNKSAERDFRETNVKLKVM